MVLTVSEEVLEPDPPVSNSGFTTYYYYMTLDKLGNLSMTHSPTIKWEYNLTELLPRLSELIHYRLLTLQATHKNVSYNYSSNLECLHSPLGNAIRQ